VVVMVFDIGNLHVKRRKGKGRSRGSSTGRIRKGRETGRERKGGEGEKREASSLP